ncbi:DUF1176 domain-containing protein [Stenotrophomonas sp.]|uniref:DUF1176 domain-containing protein n=1 Tax=Stenotrophomonas sp. TaxID=69392 RepID=UPI002D5463BA|nr:DUF1176 domain-containing protein [Stenotrophomonas sp.]HYQ24252.1 DUF1176 domain-containing protein [Stenotrophomonas sp.]
MRYLRPWLALLAATAAAGALAAPPARLPALQVAPASTRTLSPSLVASRIAGLRRLHTEALLQRQCDLEDSIARQYDQAFALDAHRELVFIGCRTGAYNASVAVFVVDHGRVPSARALDFTVAGAPPITDDAPSFELQQLGWARFDPSSQRLTETTFYRGGGDCGHAASWRWDGAAFQPETVQLQPDCLGGEPGDWPTVFRTASSPANVAREFGPPRDAPAPEPR